MICLSATPDGGQREGQGERLITRLTVTASAVMWRCNVATLFIISSHGHRISDVQNSSVIGQVELAQEKATDAGVGSIQIRRERRVTRMAAITARAAH